MQGSASPIVPSPSWTGDRGANTEIAPNRGIHGLLTGGLLTPVLPPLCALHLGDRGSTRPDWPKLRSSSDDNPRSVSYRLDTPTPPAVARRWRRLVSRSEEPSPLIRSPECTADVRFGWNPAATLPPRLDPHRPCQTRDSRYHRNAERADWLRIATQTLRAMHHENPEGSSWRPRPRTNYRQ